MKRKTFLMPLLLLTVCSFLPIKASAQNDSIVSIANVKAGTLGDRIVYKNRKAITQLTITGELNYSDFKIIRQMGNGEANFTDGKLRKLDLSNVTVIDNNGKENYLCDAALSSCEELKEVILPNKLIGIGEGAFDYCINLKSIAIPETVTTIADQAFESCETLKSVDISANIDHLGEMVFNVCNSLKAINVSENNKRYCSVGGILFNKDKTVLKECPNGIELDKYVIPSSVKTIEKYAFNECNNIQSVEIPSNVQTIGNHAFAHCKALTSIDIQNGVKTISNSAFVGCPISNIEIPASIDSIGAHAFAFTNLVSVTFPGNVKNIAPYTFSHCQLLKTITICNGVENISEYSFWADKQVTDIFNYSKTPQNLDFTSDGVDLNTCILHVPAGCINDYKLAKNWKYFSHIEEINPTAINSINADANNKILTIYNVSGASVGKTTAGNINASLEKQPRGIYIIGGKKYVR
jgi:hypothetical protein